MRQLTITFDNGPTPGITERVLDALAETGVRATFFLVGQQLQKAGARTIAERAHREGHWIGNHTFHHGRPLGSPGRAGRASEEILKTQHLLGELGAGSVLFRPNGRGAIGPHLLNREAVETLKQIKATVVLWNSIPKDRKAVVNRAAAWLDEAKRDVLSNDWTLMVLHDRHSGYEGPGPMEFLPEFLCWARKEAEFRQDFPPELTPLIAGRPQPQLSGLVS